MTEPLPQAAASGILYRDGRFLLVRRRNPPSEALYAFPGGRAEPGETPEETALREFREETGLIVHSPRLFATYDLKSEAGDPRRSHFFLSVFRVESDDMAVAVAADDADDLGWFTIEDIRALPTPPSVLACAEAVARGNHVLRD